MARVGLAPAMLAACALATLGAMPIRAAQPGAVMWVAMCGGGMQPIPLGDKQSPGRDCPGACHATCARTIRGDDGGDGEDAD